MPLNNNQKISDHLKKSFEQHYFEAKTLQNQLDDFFKNSDFLKRFPVKKFKKNDYIIKNYKDKKYKQKVMGFIYDGLVKGVFDQFANIKDRRPPVIFYGKSNWLGVDCMGQRGNTVTFIALKESHISLFPEKWIFTEAPLHVCHHIMKSSSFDILLYNSNGIALNRQKLIDRVIFALINIYVMVGQPIIEITRVDMAAYIGMERQYLSKALLELESKDLIKVNRGSIEIIDITKLYKMLGFYN